MPANQFAGRSTLRAEDIDWLLTFVFSDEVKEKIVFGRKLTSFNEGDINENSWRYVLFLVRVEKNLGIQSRVAYPLSGVQFLRRL